MEKIEQVNKIALIIFGILLVVLTIQIFWDIIYKKWKK